MDVVDGLAQQSSHRHHLQLGTLCQLVAQRDGIGHDDAIQGFGGIDAVDGRAGQHTVGSTGDDLFGTVLDRRTGYRRYR